MNALRFYKIYPDKELRHQFSQILQTQLWLLLLSEAARAERNGFLNQTVTEIIILHYRLTTAFHWTHQNPSWLICTPYSSHIYIFKINCSYEIYRIHHSVTLNFTTVNDFIKIKSIRNVKVWALMWYDQGESLRYQIEGK